MNATPVTFADRLHAIRVALAGALGETAGPPAGPIPSDGLARIVQRCGLSPFERDVLVLAAGVELDDEMARWCAGVQGDSAWSWASFGLALRVLPDPHWDALSPDAPLRGLALLEIDRRIGGLTLARLRVTERILLALLGLDATDEQLAEIALVQAPQRGILPDRQARQRDAVAAAWSASDGRPVLLRGTAPAREAFVRDLAHRVGAPRVWTLEATGLPADVSELADGARRAIREARLTGSPIVLVLDDADTGQIAVARRLAHRLSAGPRLIVSSAEPVPGLPAGARILDLPDADGAEHLAVWRTALGPAAADLNGHVERLAGQFRLPAEQLIAAARDVTDTEAPQCCDSCGDRVTSDSAGGAASTGAWSDEHADADARAARLWAACRVRARADLGGQAERIAPAAGWDDLVLPEQQLAALRDLLRHARYRATVYETWNLAGAGRRGSGVTALFAGPSGTGKSLAAEVIAAELDVDLYRVDLSQVVSKYIGETEKNLHRVFDAAEHSGAVLVIDEADALFGQRSEVKDSHDRYANVEVSYLLQRMESYHGLAILTTNLRANIDEAFIRRLGFIVTFPFPDATARTALWGRVFGRRAPVAELDPARLAQLTLSGASIRNVAVHAAFLAAERGGRVTMADLARGARSEYDKLDRPLTPAELTGWPS